MQRAVGHRPRPARPLPLDGALRARLPRFARRRTPTSRRRGRRRPPCARSCCRDPTRARSCCRSRARRVARPRVSSSPRRSGSRPVRSPADATASEVPARSRRASVLPAASRLPRLVRRAVVRSGRRFPGRLPGGVGRRAAGPDARRYGTRLLGQRGPRRRPAARAPTARAARGCRRLGDEVAWIALSARRRGPIGGGAPVGAPGVPSAGACSSAGRGGPPSPDACRCGAGSALSAASERRSLTRSR